MKLTIDTEIDFILDFHWQDGTVHELFHGLLDPFPFIGNRYLIANLCISNWYSMIG